MLTRAQAKTRECPLRAAGFLANPNENISASEGALNCRAEDCPKWVDDFEYNGQSKSLPSSKCLRLGECKTGNKCNSCLHRYGRCGS